MDRAGDTTEREQIVARSLACGLLCIRTNPDGTEEIIDPFEFYVEPDHLKESN